MPRVARLASLFVLTLLHSMAANAIEVAPLYWWKYTEINVPGTASIYQIFGHSGSTTNDATDAPYIDVRGLAGTNVLFYQDEWGYGESPDVLQSWASRATSIAGINGLSDAVGQLAFPIVAAFTTESDPYGSTPPPSTNWAITRPALNQVFCFGAGCPYIFAPQDYVADYVTYVVPTNATRLYFGFAESRGYVGQPSGYADNWGNPKLYVSFIANTPPPVPEPASGWMLLAGAMAAGLAWTVPHPNKKPVHGR